MALITVEFLRTPNFPDGGGLECEVARVPVVGDLLYDDVATYQVKLVMLAMSPGQGQPVAIVRVTVA